MEPTIEMFDWARIIFGEEHPLFFLEILFRTLVIYTYTLMLLRWLGSRALSQLSNLEFLLVIALGSAVGDAMFYPDVPLLHSLVVVTIVVLANKTLDILMARRLAVERALDGVPEEAVNAGVISLAFLKAPLSVAANFFSSFVRMELNTSVKSSTPTLRRMAFSPFSNRKTMLGVVSPLCRLGRSLPL